MGIPLELSFGQQQRITFNRHPPQPGLHFQHAFARINRHKERGLPYPRKRIVVNLAPAAVRKEGPTYDLPVALGVLLMQDLLPPGCVEDALVGGELSLEGTVRHARGTLPMTATARAQG